MISVWLVLNLMLWHWIADFVAQTNDMATKKSTSNWWLTLHILTYSAVIGIFGVLWFGFITGFVWICINGILHWITDYYTSKWSSRFFKKNDYHNGFVVVGFDQWIHLVCLLLTGVLLQGV